MWKNIRIGTKINSLVLAGLVFIVVAEGFCLLQIRNVGDRMKEITDAGIPLTEIITEVTRLQLKNANTALSLWGAPSKDRPTLSKERLKRAREEVGKMYELFEEKLAEAENIIESRRSKTKSEAARKVFEDMKGHLGIVKKDQAEQKSYSFTVLSLLDQGKPQKVQDLVRNVEAKKKEYSNQWNALLDDISRFTEESKARLQQTQQTSERLLVSILMLSIVVGFSSSILIARSITRPLSIAVGVANQLAEGDASVKIDVNSRDETGLLLKAMENMAHSVEKITTTAAEIANGNLTVEIIPRSKRDTMGIALAKMVENLQRQTREVIDGINVLTSSGSEISTSTAQLASSSAETAAAVSEITTTVEELKQTFHISHEKAKHVYETAQKAVQISQDGKKATNDTIVVMNRIREQMESIAESIVKLSEQSQAIGEIIASVDDLAEQTNLLAVNAAIEAAKAGEQGKGFAVVAQEIKSLADQSKQATAQVRTILNDIQKAVSAAVMATEQGSKAVEDGVKQSAQSGGAIQTMSNGVEEAAKASTQIVASDQQQQVGMDQVALSMEAMKQASIQNADAAKQLETAVQSLRELAQRLKQVVERYKV
jgi:methyl-accepting chemotaxis protein